jgi:GNAT superfamily N-acetyltransferase
MLFPVAEGGIFISNGDWDKTYPFISGQVEALGFILGSHKQPSNIIWYLKKIGAPQDQKQNCLDRYLRETNRKDLAEKLVNELGSENIIKLPDSNIPAYKINKVNEILGTDAESIFLEFMNEVKVDDQVYRIYHASKKGTIGLSSINDPYALVAGGWREFKNNKVEDILRGFLNSQGRFIRDLLEERRSRQKKVIINEISFYAPLKIWQRIRQAGFGDIKAISQLYQKVLDARLSSDEALEALETTWIYESWGRVRAFIKIEPHKNLRQASILFIAVEQGARRKGIGYVLVLRAIKEMLVRGYSRFTFSDASGGRTTRLMQEKFPGLIGQGIVVLAKIIEDKNISGSRV